MFVLLLEDITRRGCDLAFGEDPRGNLIQEGLEQMVVGSIDQCDFDSAGRAPQGLSGEEPAEPEPTITTRWRVAPLAGTVIFLACARRRESHERSEGFVAEQLPLNWPGPLRQHAPVGARNSTYRDIYCPMSLVRRSVAEAQDFDLRFHDLCWPGDHRKAALHRNFLRTVRGIVDYAAGDCAAEGLVPKLLARSLPVH